VATPTPRPQVYLTNDRVAKQVPMNKAELKSLALGALRRLQKLPNIVRGFFADPHLAYIHA
jgi:hypothetical protein